ncbi:MAG: hypothetical protein J5643_07165, partial [Lachnospiraceae bacterium]|nr:hypothetical protein [Lachnospiraceae bacterium]
MKDRIPTYPGRVKLVPVSGSANTYDLERADSPTQVGTPLNKASLLTDATAAAIGLTGSDPTVNDALGFLAANYNRTYYGTAAPTLQTPGKRGDIYIQDAAGSKRRFVYICDAVGTKPVDIDIAWERGSMVPDSITNDDVTHRVRSDAVLVPKGTKFSISSGFRYGLRFMNADHTYNSYVAVSSDDYTLTQDKLMRILIIRATENTSENANVTTFSSALSLTANGYHWMPVGSVREVEKEVVFTSSGVFIVPADLRGNVTIRAFGGGAGGSTTAKGYGGGGGHMAVYTGPLTAKRYNVKIGKGGAPGSNGGASSFGSLVTANGGSGGGGGYATGSYPAGTNTAGNGTYGGGGGGGAITAGGNGGTYGGGG